MKKLLCVGLVIGLLTVGGYTFTVHAQNSNDEQVSDYLILSILRDEMQKAVADYYQNDVGIGADGDTQTSIFIKYEHDNNKDLVEVLQSEKGHELEYSYVVRVNITPQKNGDLGRDTITFGIETEPELSVKMLNYKHSPIEQSN
jgi:hypothetical protein